MYVVHKPSSWFFPRSNAQLNLLRKNMRIWKNSLEYIKRHFTEGIVYILAQTWAMLRNYSKETVSFPFPFLCMWGFTGEKNLPWWWEGFRINHRLNWYTLPVCLHHQLAFLSNRRFLFLICCSHTNCYEAVGRYWTPQIFLFRTNRTLIGSKRGYSIPHLYLAILFLR